MNLLRSLTVLVLVACSACASQGERLKLYKFTPQPASARLEDAALAVTVERAQSAAGATNYVLHVTVANTAQEPAEFKSTALQLVDSEGISHPVIDPSSGMMMLAGILRDQSIPPGQKLKGALYFQTATGEARSKKLTLRFGKSSLDFANVGFLTNDDLESQNAFRD